VKFTQVHGLLATAHRCSMDQVLSAIPLKQVNIYTVLIQVFFKFSGNKAVISSALFTANLDLCSWTQFENRHFFAPEKVFQWDFVHIRYYTLYSEN